MIPFGIVFFKNLIFLLKINFLCVLDRFDTLILKIKKNYFNAFQYKKYFKKQSQPQSL
jgi:hypothetical protein